MLTLFFALLSCTNSGLGKSPTGDTGPDFADCPWEGEWELRVVNCGEFNTAYAPWDATYDEATLEISRNNEGAGGCDAVFTWSNAVCAEEEVWEILPLYPELTEDQETSTVPWDGTARVSMKGISDCSPEGCRIDPVDMEVQKDACEEGERVLTIEVEVDDSIPDQLEITGLFSDPGRSDCPLDLRTSWVKK